MTTPSTTLSEFTILDDEPVFKRAKGRAKSPLRVAIEALPVGKSMVAGHLDDDDKSNKNQINSVRQKAQEIRTQGKQHGEDIRFSIRVDVENRIIVTRKS